LTAVERYNHLQETAGYFEEWNNGGNREFHMEVSKLRVLDKGAMRRTYYVDNAAFTFKQKNIRKWIS